MWIDRVITNKIVDMLIGKEWVVLVLNINILPWSSI